MLMKSTSTARLLVGTFKYSNVTVESTITLEEEVNSSEERLQLLDKSNKLALESLHRQKEAMDKEAAEFFTLEGFDN